MSAGLTTTSLPYGPLANSIASPTVWLLSDLPFLAAEAFGILARLQVDVPARSGLVMIGGAYSFQRIASDWRLAGPARRSAAAGGADSWGRRRRSAEWRTTCRDRAIAPRALLPCSLTARHSSATIACGRAPSPDVLAEFEDGEPALIVSASTPRRVVAFASDLLPHWGPTHAQWEGLPALLAALCALAAGDEP